MTKKDKTTARIEHAKRLVTEVQSWSARKLHVTYSQLNRKKFEPKQSDTQQSSNQSSD
jgi:hypothetical protein